MTKSKKVIPSMIANSYHNSKPYHPGTLIKEELEARDISQRELSEGINASYKLINDVLNGKKPLSADLALLISAYLNISPHLLMTLQTGYDMAKAYSNKSFSLRLANIRKAVAF